MRKDRIQKLVDFLRGLDEDKFDLDYRDNPHDRDCGGPVSWLPAIFPHLVKWRGSAGLVATAKLEEEWDDPEKEEWLNDMWAETGYADCRNCWDDVTMVLFEIHYDHVVYLFDGGHAADIGVPNPKVETAPTQ